MELDGWSSSFELYCTITNIFSCLLRIFTLLNLTSSKDHSNSYLGNGSLQMQHSHSFCIITGLKVHQGQQGSITIILSERCKINSLCLALFYKNTDKCCIKNCVYLKYFPLFIKKWASALFPIKFYPILKIRIISSKILIFMDILLRLWQTGNYSTMIFFGRL